MAKFDPDFVIRGTICAPLTPFSENGQLNMDPMDKYVEFLDQNAIDGVFINGTMGESVSLNLEERKRLAEFWVKATEKTERLKTVVVNVTALCLSDAIELARHSEQIGASGIASLVPFYYKPKNESVAVNWLQKVAEAAPNTPFYYYDIDFFTGVYLNNSKILELGAEQIPTLRGAKISSISLPAMLNCKHVANGRFQIMIGTDEQFLPALSIGIRVPVLSSHLGKIFERLRTKFDAKNVGAARREQEYVQKLAKNRDVYGGGPAIEKSRLRLMGLDLGSVRAPLVDLTKEQERQLRIDLVDIGLIKE